VPGHGEVDGDGVATFYAVGFENVCDAAYFVEEFRVGDLMALTGFVCFVDYGGLMLRVVYIYMYIELACFVRMFECPTINAVVRSV
jgi:hypothetical protein